MNMSIRSTVCALAGTVLLAAGENCLVPDPLLDGRVIVRILEGSTIGEVIAELEAALPGSTFAVADDSFAHQRFYLLSYEAPQPDDEVELVLDGTGELGEFLYKNWDPEDRTGSVWFHSLQGGLMFHDQYAADMLGLGPAQVRVSGAGVVVAVVDTGIDDAHPLLQDAIAPGGYNFITDSPDTVDLVNGHGTFVAGLIHLVAPDADLLPIVVLDADGAGDLWLLTKGILHAIDEGADVINLSLGSTYDSEAVDAATIEAIELGIVVVAAGGNCGLGEEGEVFPAAGEVGAFGVAAVDDGDVKWGLSNYHPNFFISAPGTSAEMIDGPDGFDPERTIYSAIPGGEYGIWEGTSLATAFVSGGAALLHAQHPEWPADATTHGRMAALLAETAVSIFPPNPPQLAGQLGAGRLDVGAAVALGAGDLNGDGVVDIGDFLMLLARWGLCPGGDDDPCFADLDNDGSVGIVDFLFLIANWG